MALYPPDTSVGVHGWHGAQHISDILGAGFLPGVVPFLAFVGRLIVS